jgi:hypothetical protein
MLPTTTDLLARFDKLDDKLDTRHDMTMEKLSELSERVVKIEARPTLAPRVEAIEKSLARAAGARAALLGLVGLGGGGAFALVQWVVGLFTRG